MNFNNDNFEKLINENNELRKDKTILEEIILEKDKLIGNLQLQIDNLQKFSNVLKTPLTPILGPPPRSAQRQLRSVSNPVIEHAESKLYVKMAPPVGSPVVSPVVSPVGSPVGSPVTLQLIPPLDQQVPPITIDEESPAKSIASSDYSPHITRNRLSTTSVITTPLASPSRPSAQQAHHMGILVSEMTWGSSPRNVSPYRGKNPPLSPLKDQLFANMIPNLATPSNGHAIDEEEFNFSPISGNNGSSSNIVKLDHLIGSVSTRSIRSSIDSFDKIKHKRNGSGNDLDSVIEFMDKKLMGNTKERPRASTVNTVVSQEPVEHLKPPLLLEKTLSDPLIPRLPSRDKGYLPSPVSSMKMFKPQTATPTTINSEKFSDFDDADLKGLMVRPGDLPTTLVSVISVIDGSLHTGRRKIDDPSMTFGCFLVENTGEKREIFKFSKTYSQLIEFDSIVRPHFFELLPLPELTSFIKTTPQTVEFRRQILNNYFYKLFELKVKPKDLLLSICKFISTDPVFKFDFNEHIMKEGYMLRKSTGKLSISWKVTFCTVLESTLELTDQSSGKKQVLNIMECKLANEEDTRDVRHGISILEPRRNVLSSSNNKILLCAESYEDKAEWLEALAKASSNLRPQYVKTSNSLPVPEPSPELSRHNNTFSNSRIGSPSTMSNVSVAAASTKTNTTTTTNTATLASSEPPATPLAQSYSFDDSSTLNSVSKPKKRVNLFSMMKTNRPTSPEKTIDDSITPSTVIEPVTNLEQYQQQHQYQPQNPLPSATDSSFSFSPYSPAKSFSTRPELFGASLETAIELSSTEYKGRTIPSICFRCIDYLEKKDAIYSEGIFRLTGKSSEINLLNDLFNTKYDVDFATLDKLPDVDSISTLLKRYLRSMKESVITVKLVTSLKQLPNSIDEKALYYKKEVNSLLPNYNFDLLYILLNYLIKVIKNKEYNKMDINNITMLFSVNFNVDDDILSELIIDFDYIFNNAAQPIPEEKRPLLRR